MSAHRSCSGTYRRLFCHFRFQFRIVLVKIDVRIEERKKFPARQIFPFSQSKCNWYLLSFFYGENAAAANREVHALNELLWLHACREKLPVPRDEIIGDDSIGSIL